MHRIDTDSRAIDLHGPGMDGFTDGDPIGGEEATIVSDDWCNAVQEELASLIESQGIALDKGDNTQLAAAISALIGSSTAGRELALSTWIDLPSGTGLDLLAVATAITGTNAWRAIAVGSGGVALQLGHRVTAEATGVAVTLRAVAGGPTADVFVAVGDAGTIVRRDVGGWATQASGTGVTLRGVWYADGLWVAVGDGGTILTSPSGVVWTPASGISSYNLYAVHRAAGLWIACGASSAIYRSTDGVSWVLTRPGTTDLLTAVSFTGDLWLIAGSAGASLIGFESADGIAWSSVAPPGPGLFAGGLRWRFGAYVHTSDDGLAWTQRFHLDGLGVAAVARVRGRWFAVGVGGLVLGSLSLP